MGFLDSYLPSGVSSAINTGLDTVTAKARDIGSSVGNFFKPDGTSAIPDANLNNITRGAASVVTGATDLSQCTAFNIDTINIKSVTDVASALFKSWDTELITGEAPYENVLEQFASYAPVWTLACLTPNQANNPYLYRNNPNALTNIVLSSAGRYGSRRVQLMEGRPEYYVNNFEMRHQTAGDPARGMTNQIQMDFDVYEPYSMGLFLQSLQAAAINAGYLSYNNTPYVLKLEFLGYRDDGSMFSPSDYLTKYFVVHFIDIKFTTNEGGSTYKCSTVPDNSLGFMTNVQSVLTAMNLTAPPGKTTVADLLSKGTTSLVAALNKQQDERVQHKLQSLPDHYSIVYPTDFSDRVGLESSTDFPLLDEIVMAVEDALEEDGDISPESPIKFEDTEDVGEGPVGASDMGFDPNSGGNYTFSLTGDVVNADGTITRENLTIDPKSRTFSFPADSLIQNIIAQVVLSSQYAKDALDPANLLDGKIKWFRIDVQIQLGELDVKRGERAKNYIYRVMPYYVSASVFKNPTSPAAGKDELNKIIAKKYNYIYTGQNNDVLKFDIQINNLFKAGMLPRPAEKTETEANSDGNAPTDDPGNRAEGVEGNNVAQLASPGNQSGAPDKDITKGALKGGYGAKDVQQLVVQQLYNSILTNGKRDGGDLVQVQLEILGDPYWLVDQGMGNWTGDTYNGPDDQITLQQTMNYQGTDTYIKIIFKTPVEPNTGIAGDGGLYKFQWGGIESPFSGIYKVNFCTNKFSDGAFKQILECVRMPFDDGSTPVNILDVMLTKANVPDKSYTSTFNPDEDPWGDLEGAIAAQKEGVTDPSDPDGYGEG